MGVVRFGALRHRPCFHVRASGLALSARFLKEPRKSDKASPKRDEQLLHAAATRRNIQSVLSCRPLALARNIVKRHRKCKTKIHGPGGPLGPSTRALEGIARHSTNGPPPRSSGFLCRASCNVSSGTCGPATESASALTADSKRRGATSGRRLFAAGGFYPTGVAMGGCRSIAWSRSTSTGSTRWHRSPPRAMLVLFAVCSAWIAGRPAVQARRPQAS